MFKPPLANSQYRPQSAQNRPMGNAQARNPALAPAPAYGNTTNPTGSQTAGRKMAGIPVGPRNQGPILPYTETQEFLERGKIKTPIEIQNRQGSHGGRDVYALKAASFGQIPSYSEASNGNPYRRPTANNFFRELNQADGTITERTQQIQAEYEAALRAQQQPRPENFAPRSQQNSPMMGMPAPVQPTGPTQQDILMMAQHNGPMMGRIAYPGSDVVQPPGPPQQSSPAQPTGPTQQAGRGRTMQHNGPMMGQPSYAGGDVAGISEYYRNAAKQQYARNSPLQSSGTSPLQAFDQQQTMAGMGNTTDQINALTRQSQIANPMMANAPMAGVPNMQGISDARMAPMMARDAAMQQNTPANGFVAAMNDPNRLTPDMKEQIARSAVNRQMSGGPAADPTGMFGRFNENTALGQGASEYERGLAGVAAGEGVMIQPGGRGSNSQYLGFNSTPEDAERAAQASAGRGNAAVRAKYDNPEAIAKRQAFASGKAGKAAAFREANDGMNYKQVDRLEKKRSSIQRKIDSGKISPREGKDQIADATAQQIRRGDGKSSSGMAGIKLSEMPKNNLLKTQSPEKATESVQILAENSPHIKHHGWTAATTPQEFANSIGPMDPSKMTSQQKFEVARSYHDFMLAQSETGNPDWQPGEADPNDPFNPRTLLSGLRGIKPGNKDQMVSWFDSLIGRARKSTDQNRLLGLEPTTPGFTYDVR